MQNKITTAIIPAAGKGSRIADLPLTRILPKPLLPLLNKPIAEYIVDWLKTIGIKKIYLIVSFKQEILREYFGDGSDFGVSIEYIQCPKPRHIGGLADGIYLAKKLVKRPFIVVLGDDFTITSSFKSIVTDYFKNNALALEVVVKENNPEALRRACAVNFDHTGRIIDIIEKPEKPKWLVRGCGIYIFDPIVFDFIEETPFENGKRDITKTIQIMAKRTGRVYKFMVEKNININTLADLRQANSLLLKNERI